MIIKPFKIFLNESIFSKNIIPNYAAFFKKEDPQLYQEITNNLNATIDRDGKITEQDFNIEIENYLYNPQYISNFDDNINGKLPDYFKELVELKNSSQKYANISTGKRKRKRVRTHRI